MSKACACAQHDDETVQRERRPKHSGSGLASTYPSPQSSGRRKIVHRHLKLSVSQSTQFSLRPGSLPFLTLEHSMLNFVLRADPYSCLLCCLDKRMLSCPFAPASLPIALDTGRPGRETEPGCASKPTITTLCASSCFETLTVDLPQDPGSCGRNVNTKESVQWPVVVDRA